jgi:hypothetical protein
MMKDDDHRAITARMKGGDEILSKSNLLSAMRPKLGGKE